MGTSFQFNDITNQVSSRQAHANDQASDSNNEKQSANLGVGLSKENQRQAHSLIISILEGAKKVVISNKNSRRKPEELTMFLMLNSVAIRLLLTKKSQRFDYLYQFSTNELLLNDAPATELDGERFTSIFNRILSRMVEDQYEVIRDD